MCVRKYYLLMQPFHELATSSGCNWESWVGLQQTLATVSTGKSGYRRWMKNKCVTKSVFLVAIYANLRELK